MSTMCPTLVVKDGEPIMAIGSPGSWCIPPAIVQILNAVLLFDMDLQQAINEPRAIFTSYSAPLKVYAEPRLPEETIQALIDAGYEVDSGKDWNTSLGSVGVVLVDPEDTCSMRMSRMVFARFCRSAAVWPVFWPEILMTGVCAVRLTLFTYRRSATSTKALMSSSLMETDFSIPFTLSAMPAICEYVGVLV